MKKGNIIFASVLLVGMLFLLVITLQLPEPIDEREIGAGYVPTLYIGMSIALLISIVFTNLKSGKDKKFDLDLKLLGYLFVIIIYVVAIDHIGYYISTFLTLVTLLIMLGERRKITLFSIPIGFIIFIYVVFVRFVNLRI